MGFTIDWHRAGLGVSLLADEPTLLEEHGKPALHARMREETALQERLWEGLVPEQRQADTEQGQVVETPDDAAPDEEIYP